MSPAACETVSTGVAGRSEESEGGGVAPGGAEMRSPRCPEIADPGLELPGFPRRPAAGGGEERDPVVHSPVCRFGVRRPDLAEPDETPDVAPRVGCQDE